MHQEPIKVVCCPDCEGLPVLKMVNGDIVLSCKECGKEFSMNEAGWKSLIFEVSDSTKN